MSHTNNLDGSRTAADAGVRRAQCISVRLDLSNGANSMVKLRFTLLNISRLYSARTWFGSPVTLTDISRVAPEALNKNSRIVT